MNDGIETRLVYGLLGAGKTTYLRESIQNDYFYKYGSTLILCFEQGEEDFDADFLAGRNTLVRYYDGSEDVGAFCARTIKETKPERIYVEMNTMMEHLRSHLPERMKITFSVTLIDWTTMALFFRNFRQMFQRMVTDSQQVVFRGCPSRELLVPYSQQFRLMNQTASYLRQDPMGYHERAFDRYLPFSLENTEITISGENYLSFWLDSFDNPEHYQGKTLRFIDPLELRRSADSGFLSAGRTVMVCCMADLQFMSLPLEEREDIPSGGWIIFHAKASISRDKYGRNRLSLQPEHVISVSPPDRLILSSDLPRSRNTDSRSVKT